MRVTSEFYVAALLRQVTGSGGFGTILRRGDRQAGAIFLVNRARGGAMALYGPAPQALCSPDGIDSRCFVTMRPVIDPESLEQWIEKEARFDSDFWVLELEPGSIPFEEMVRIVPADTRST